MFFVAEMHLDFSDNPIESTQYPAASIGDLREHSCKQCLEKMPFHTATPNILSEAPQESGYTNSRVMYT